MRNKDGLQSGGGDFARKTKASKIINPYLRNFTDEVFGRFSNITLKAGKSVTEQVSGELGEKVANKVLEKNK
ncbi:MAG: hypothetical protein A2015_00090 [Spirochaetes bacterium GWF1_31_7]|nr:MAG: hypothetical protein A2Y30_00265 [Spirochaetes bacterium GWE1_32_154]OHD50986.1 MAG: hypothetical protein A2Y29_10590 [Spirochaetes bacterium GWE2_31_10]OHD51640.1 MAG: hypothetical protein A2015_00090 [Spirochaetes bacterium GWF1_31_7]OHD73386.1 MAG: hypothetical protein A2355_08080 [Spirochaetes bacterium RIFOXYB1_FULL_32_8]HBD94985.1 hypothetical protein [Spirochaetia bacterium]